MESNEQTELTSKIETDSQVTSRLTASGRVKGVEGLSRKVTGLMDVDNSVVTVVRR